MKIEELNEDQKFWITLVAEFMDELVHENIITNTQRYEAGKFINRKLEKKSNEKKNE